MFKTLPSRPAPYPLPNCALKVDLIECFENGGKHIVLNYAADNNNCMERLAKYLDSLTQHDVHPDILITTIRETDAWNYQMSHMLALLEAIAVGTPNLEGYYNQNISEKSPTKLAPMPQSLSYNAFVLHLDKQDNMNANSLDRYWNYNAETVKQMLDLALARL